MSNNSCGFIHLTDLHFGQRGLPWLWPNVKEEFYEDLKWAQGCSGPWDFMLFTGDLVFSGKDPEFKKLDEQLQFLFEFIKRFQGYEPAFLPVPGNHDMQRPDKADPALKALSDWHNSEEVRESFWKGEPYYDHIKRNAFSEYHKWVSVWRSRWPGNYVRHWKDGLLAGEFSVRFEIGEISIGVVGLNTAFLDLSDNFRKGMLALELRQLADACPTDPPSWLKNNAGNLLLTHHPNSWFGNKDYESEINIKDYFCIHLCGHMHVPGSELKSKGGGYPRVILTGASMFGLENFKERDDGNMKKRIHGYSTGRISFKTGRPAIRVWPRIMVSLQDGPRRLGPDLSFVLDRSSLASDLAGIAEPESIGEESEAFFVRTGRFAVGHISAIKKATDNCTEMDIIVAYSLDRIARGGELKRLRLNPEARIRVILANVGDPLCRKMLNRKFGYTDDELKKQFQEHLSELLGKSTTVAFDESVEPGKVRVTALPEDFCKYEVYVTNIAITQSYYRVDDAVWILPLWMQKAKNPPPRVWELLRNRSPKSFSDYVQHFEQLREESTCVFKSKS